MAKKKTKPSTNEEEKKRKRTPEIEEKDENKVKENKKGNKKDISEKKEVDSSDDDFSSSSDEEDEIIHSKAFRNKIVAFEYKTKEYPEHSNFIFYKQHQGKIPNRKGEEENNTGNDRMKGHVLFCTNLPVYTEMNELSNLFSKSFDSPIGECFVSHLEVNKQFITPNRIAISSKEDETEQEETNLYLSYKSPFSSYQEKPFLSNGTAHILINKTSSVKKALEKDIHLIKEGSTNKQEIEIKKNNGIGLKRYIKEFTNDKLPSGDKLKEYKKELNTWMVNFDKKDKEREKIIDTLRNVPDEKGWVKVFNRPGRHSEELLTATDLENKKKNKKNKKTGRAPLSVPFYKFQRVEKKKKEFEELRDQFEKDLQILEKMKQQKKFEPIHKEE
ncbi:hypothetical protein ABK040_015133 [Willaertia magna]